VIAYNMDRCAGVKSRRRERCEVPGARIQELGRSWKAGFRNGGVPGEVEVRVLLSLVIEARMLLKIKAVRRDLRKFSWPARFLIVLNLNRLSDCGGERGARIQRVLRAKPECY
jgi:hypothetical protein